MTFKILFWLSNSHLILHFEVWNPIFHLTEFGPNMAFCHFKSYFDIRIGAEYLILTFEILFWHSNSKRILYFDIHDSVFTLQFRKNITLWHSNSYYVIYLGSNISFWHSKSYFDIRIEPEYHNLTFEILFWHSNFGAEYRFCRSESYFNFHNWAEYRFCRSESYFDFHMIGANITFCQFFFHSNWNQ